MGVTNRAVDASVHTPPALTGLDEVELRLLNDFQRGFPIVPEPFAVIAARLGTSEARVIESLRELKRAGAVSRVGPLFRPHTLGASTLAAMAVPPARLEEVAAVVNSYPHVNHNYEREHRVNLWFVITGPDRATLQAVMKGIASRTDLQVHPLPMLADYHIDLGFPLAIGGLPPGYREPDPTARVTPPAPANDGTGAGSPGALSAAEWAVVEAIQSGLPLTPRPFEAAGKRIGLNEEIVRKSIQVLLRRGCIKRFGIVVHHHKLGYRANAMVVWDVPDMRADELGRSMAKWPFVTLCYRRARHLPVWPYNLFCMIHGRDRNTVRRQLGALIKGCGLDGLRHEVLFSGRRFKQRGALYRIAGEDAAEIVAA